MKEEIRALKRYYLIKQLNVRAYIVVLVCLFLGVPAVITLGFVTGFLLSTYLSFGDRNLYQALEKKLQKT